MRWNLEIICMNEKSNCPSVISDCATPTENFEFLERCVKLVSNDG